ncbi:hypothetical protein L596_016945 [Steinernema carpocapsae]|uniref:Uncharacterized protein n=1 Tax=Steinernema carpocapsae TaxID=34508 RepID=A0A4U5N061_STECR|nr:hypothetical protein L596_016945 [Steinernema carpocapsae]
MLTLKNLNLALPSVSRIIPMASASRKTGRGSSSVALPGSAWRYDLSNQRYFTRKMTRRYGVDMGLQDTIFILSSGASKKRKLDGKRRKQLSEIYGEKICGLFGENEAILPLKLEIIDVSVNSSLTELEVKWKARGDDSDLEIQKTLETVAKPLREALSSAMFASNVPQIKFVADRTHLMIQEMDNLFKIADYGMQYRALSHTGAVLGSMSDTGMKKDEEKKPRREKKTPKWVKNPREIPDAPEVL